MPVDPELRAHYEWLGFLQPVGLVVSPPALVAAQAFVDRNIVAEQHSLLGLVTERRVERAGGTDDERAVIADFPRFCVEFLGWEPADLAGAPGGPALSERLDVALPEYGEVLSPTYAVPDPDHAGDWLMLVTCVDTGTDLDAAGDHDTQGWHAGPQARMERLLRAVGVPIGLVFNGTHLRLVYAPRGESSGHLTFPVDAMGTVAGRPIVAALHMLLSAERLFTVPTAQRLPALLRESRKYQNTVSTRLAEQVLDALWALLRGFQAANEATHGTMLRDVLAAAPDEVYGGLLATILRLVFVLYAEDRGLLPTDEVYVEHYSVTGLFAQLREDAARYPDTMDQRFGAWARLLTLFRLLYDGGVHGTFRIPARHGHLFDPDAYPFLEGRLRGSARGDAIMRRLTERGLPPGTECGAAGRPRPGHECPGSIQAPAEPGARTNSPPSGGGSLEPGDSSPGDLEPGHSSPGDGGTGSLILPGHDPGHECPGSIQAPAEAGARTGHSSPGDGGTGGPRIDPPRVADGVLYRVLENLLLLDGERLSYRTLDVEQIGSVYEGMMGFALRVATGPSVAVRPDHVVLDLAELLATKPAERGKQLKDTTACDLKGAGLEQLKTAATVDEVVAALGKRVSPRTPNLLPAGAMYLQPTEERRRSGSHYTPRSLTEPIVRTTLEPVLAALGQRPRPEQILDLKVCDPATGSGAFLVEACRFLGDHLVAAWQVHEAQPVIPPDEDPALFARRLVAQRCLYGIDKNPFAVDLAKLSLWLATLARDHPFTFVDHAVRHGDSLVGLTREQIACFHWEPEEQLPMLRELLTRRVAEAEALRRQIEDRAGSDDTDTKAALLAQADAALRDVRLAGDLAVAAFFGADKPSGRETLRKQYAGKLELHLAGRGVRGELAAATASLRQGDKGVPPFHWQIEFPEVFGRDNGGFDAIVGNPPFAGKNNVIDSNRPQYLPWLQAARAESHGNSDLVAHFFRLAFDRLREGGTFGLVATNTIAQGDTRSTGLRWICTHAGQIYAARKRLKWPGAAAVVVSVVHVRKGGPPLPCVLDGRPVEQITAFLFHTGGQENPAQLAANASRSFIGSYVLGMGFTFDDDNPDATPIAEMHRLIAKDARNAERIFPYIGGEEVNDSPAHAHRRYVINFGDMSEAEARRWPDLMAIVEAKVKEQRLHDKRASYRTYWWQYAEKRGELYRAIAGLDRVLAIARVTQHHCLAWLHERMVYSEQLVASARGDSPFFAILQSRPHEIWARFFGSSLEDRLRYTPSDCFETFPFPLDWEANTALEEAGRTYYDFRAALMVKNDEGLTKTYNRFHDPNETSADILELRGLHAAMDRAVLDAYGWTDLHPTCEFLLDYEEDDDAAQPSKKKKPWRYRWPDDLRDEVLGRLLALNRERAEQEALAGAGAAKAEKKATRGRKRKNDASAGGTGELF